MASATTYTNFMTQIQKHGTEHDSGATSNTPNSRCINSEYFLSVLQEEYASQSPRTLVHTEEEVTPHTTTQISRTVNTPAEPMSYTYHHINPRKRSHANSPLSSPNKIQPPKNELKEDHEQAKKTCPLQRGYVQRRIFSRRGSQGCQKKIR